MLRTNERDRPPSPLPLLPLKLFGGFVRLVREIGARRSRPTVVVFLPVRVYRMGDHLVTLMLVGEQLLESDDGADDQRDLADRERLEREQGKAAQRDRYQSGGLQFEQQQDRQQRLDDLLLLSSGWNRNGSMDR